MAQTTLVTGGSGYIGALLVRELGEAGHDVRVLDSLLHGQEDIAAEQERAGVEVIRADIRDADARRRALSGANAVVHLAAIVGDPACALDKELSDEVNVQATRALVADAGDAVVVDPELADDAAGGVEGVDAPVGKEDVGRNRGSACRLQA